MKLRICAVVLLCLVLASAAAAQFTTVTGTVLDPNGIPYASGTITAQLILTGTTPTLNGKSFSMTGSSGLSSAGSFTMQLADNNVMVPSGLKWSFTVCSGTGSVLPAGGTGPQCFTPASITITGASQSISAQLSSAAPALTLPPGTGTVVVTLTPAQIKAFDNTVGTSVVVVPAPAANQMIEVLSWTANLQFPTSGGAAYATGTGNLVLGTNTAGVNSAWGTLFLTGVLKSGSSQYDSSSSGFQDAGGVSVAFFAGQALLINQSAATLYTTGNSPIVVTVSYRIIFVA